MKNIKLKIKIVGLSILAVMFFHTSCSDDLTVVNQNKPTDASYYKNADQMYASMIGSYSRIKSWGLYGIEYFKMWNSWSDLGMFHQSEYQKLPDLANPNHRGSIELCYETLYIGISRANKTIEMLDADINPGLVITDNLRQEYTQESLVLRAFFLLKLTSYFNEPPLVTETLNDPNKTFTNASRSEFYSQIISDLKNAIGEGDMYTSSALPTQRSGGEVGRITYGTALALLGKAYLYKASFAPAENLADDYTNARKYFRELISLDVYSLVQAQDTLLKDYMLAFNSNFTDVTLSSGVNSYPGGENNSESIFEAQYINNPSSPDIWESGYTADGHINNAWFAPGGYKAIGPTNKFVKFFDNDDPRKHATLFLEGDTILKKSGLPEAYSSTPGTHSSKAGIGVGWKKYFYPMGNAANGSYGSTNIKIIRYSDVLLMLAECDLALGELANSTENEGGLWALNHVRARVGLDPVAALSFEIIEKERVCELGFEGERYQDLVRWNLNANKWIEDLSEELDDFQQFKHEFLPIPETEIIRNPGLQQNPGY